MQVAPHLSVPLKMFLDIAAHEVGVHETGGANKGPRVEQYQFAIDHVAAGQSWCMCFVQWCLLQVEEQLKVGSDVYRSDNCMATWQHTSPHLRTQTPEPGCIVIWRKVGGTSGHTGIVEMVDVENKVLLTIEGNTSNANVAEGDCVARKKRPLSGPHGFQTVGYIRPFWGVSIISSDASQESPDTPSA